MAPVSRYLGETVAPFQEVVGACRHFAWRGFGRMAGLKAYLDYNASTPLRPCARDAAVRWIDSANASSTHAAGRTVRAEIERCRSVVAGLAGGGTVIFTSGATEAAHTALTPHYVNGRTPGRFDTLLVSATEHACVLAGGRFPTERVHTVPVDAKGSVDLDALDGALRSATGRSLVAVMLANNETGVVQDIAAIAAVVHAHDGLLVCDAVQGFGRMDVAAAGRCADVLLLSGHKLGGPKGAGAVVVRDGSPKPEPLLAGGGQEGGHRGGTENVSAISGLASALQVACEDDSRHFAGLRERFEAKARSLHPQLTIHGEDARRLPNTSLFSFTSIPAETAVIAFDLGGIAVSSGSACSSGKVGESHVLAAMGAARTDAVRLSVGHATTLDEIDAALATFARLAERDLEKTAARALAEAA